MSDHQYSDLLAHLMLIGAVLAHGTGTFVLSVLSLIYFATSLSEARLARLRAAAEIAKGEDK